MKVQFLVSLEKIQYSNFKLSIVSHTLWLIFIYFSTIKFHKIIYGANKSIILSKRLSQYFGKHLVVTIVTVFLSEQADLYKFYKPVQILFLRSLSYIHFNPNFLYLNIDFVFSKIKIYTYIEGFNSSDFRISNYVDWKFQKSSLYKSIDNLLKVPT